jgi:type I restriction-modification system DNA methylase subunit
MPLFQNSVVTKYLQAQKREKVALRWNDFKAYFHDPEIQQNIREAKEEQFQEGFLRELFVKVLGYTLYPQPGFNLTTEYKNVKDSKKADGAIIINEAVKAVIELKATNTTDLSKVESQAFGYKNNQPDCIYVITSNFEKLRLYIDNAIEHIEFNLFALTEREFDLLWLCLAYKNIEKGIAKKIKDESVGQEDEITKQLYKDYSLFKRELYQNLVNLNPQYEPLELFKKSQKLLDRFLFLFFAEDRLLLPPNSVKLVLDDWKDLQDKDVDISLYERFKKYFGYLNTGFKGKRYDVFAYNGGLFKPDEILDALKMDNDLLYRHTLRLSEYDFVSEVDVNILGHIFENSLNELDEIKAQLEGKETDKSKTKRKKDGVFYTPKYITKYIVDNTVGKLCSEKKAEQKINEEDYTTDRRMQQKTKQELVDKLGNYRRWLLQLTICDPACGSGAFLNQALDFLIREHRYIDELQAKLFGDALVLSDIENSILENNLYGVDLNEESVEIAKLSLWLRTAQPNRKLNDLNNNIKCGNSLIDDPAVAGDKAFNWQQEFPKVFEKGGFDVVIGNPPYGALLESEIDVSNETYLLFYKKGFELIRKEGILSFITPDSWLINRNAKFIRKLFRTQGSIVSIRDVYKVFNDAPDVWCNIPVIIKGAVQGNISISRDKPYDYSIFQFILSSNRLIEYNDNEWFVYINENYYRIFKIMEKNKPLSYFCSVRRGFSPTPNEINTTKIQQRRQLIGGEDFGRYTFKINPKYLKDNYEKSKKNIEYVLNSEFIAIQRIRTNSLKIDSRWLICNIFREKMLVPNDSVGYLTDFKSINPLYILALLNSNLLNIFYKFQYTDKNVKPIFLSKLPIPDISDEVQYPFIEKANLMLMLNKNLNESSYKFQNTIKRRFETNDLTKKLEEWYLLSYTEFIKELGKKKIKLSLSDEAEWETYFTQEAAKTLQLKTKIETTDKEIDRMVYELYGLTEEEIEIVEKG